MAVKLFIENAIGKVGCVLKNGTGGGAPALDQNADWPTRYSLIRDRSLFWRAQAGGLGPHVGVYLFDYDFGAAVNIGAAGFCRLRPHPKEVIPTTLAVDVLYGSSYPPATRQSLALTASDSDNLKEFGPVSARYWRVEVTALVSTTPVEISGNPWLVEAANIITLPNPRPGSTILSERIRENVASPAGSSFHHEPGGQVRAARRRDVVLDYQFDGDGTLTSRLRDTIAPKSERIVVQDYEGAFIETTLPGGEAEWDRVFLAANRLQARFEGAV